MIVGGGSAGWLTAGILAAEHKTNCPDCLRVKLVESPEVNPVGVGEAQIAVQAVTNIIAVENDGVLAERV